MAEEETNEQPESSEVKAGEDTSQSARPRRSRLRSLTPEQRRLLGTPRPLHERADAEQQSDAAAVMDESSTEPREPQKPPAKERVTQEAREEKLESEGRERSQHAPIRRPDDKSSRAIEMQHAALIIGAILVLGLTFYVGKKFDYWRYVLMAKNEPKLTEKIPNKFPDTSADELIEQALAAEQSSNWYDAVERLLGAKYKNLKYRGILFRVGKIAYDRGDFTTADKLFDRAIAFGENVDTANYFRGLIATRRRDLPAALRFFEAAANADPFSADYYYYWAEALRLDHHPKDAIRRYEQAERRARGDQDVKVCQFKVRMARLEAGETAKLKTEIEKKGSAGPLALDWLLTSAAVAIREGRIDDAARLLTEARALSTRVTNGPGIFVSCTRDTVFQEACQKHSELADICQANPTSQAPPP